MDRALEAAGGPAQRGGWDEEGRPDPQVLQVLQGRTLLHTDRNGWIELSPDGKQMVWRWIGNQVSSVGLGGSNRSNQSAQIVPNASTHPDQI